MFTPAEEPQRARVFDVRHVPLRDGDALVVMVSFRDVLAVLAET